MTFNAPLPRHGGFIFDERTAVMAVDMLKVNEPFYAVFNRNCFNVLKERTTVYETCAFFVKSKQIGSSVAVIIERTV